MVRSVFLFLLHARFGVVQSWGNIAHRRVEQAQSLTKQLQEGSSKIDPSVSVVPIEGECGIQCGGSPMSKEVITIDRQEFLSAAVGWETNVGKALASYLENHPRFKQLHEEMLPTMAVAIYLCLVHQGQASDFSLYVETLPPLDELQHLPIFWSDALLKELQSSEIQSAVLSRRQEWQDEYVLIQKAALEAEAEAELPFVFPLNLWFWARSICTSRCFLDQATKEPCLVPYVDMMNHVSDDTDEVEQGVTKCTWDIDKEGYHLRLPDGIPTSTLPTRLEISYGSKSNADLLINYGFVGHSQIHETAKLPLHLPESVPAPLQALWEADEMGHSHLSRNVTVAIGEIGPVQSALSLCRVACTRDQELSRMQDAFVKRGETTTQTEDGLVPQMGATLCRSPFSTTNEIRAMKMLRQAASDALSAYSTTLEQDENMMQQQNTSSEKLSLPMKYALQVRIGEKQILQHFCILASLALNFLDSAEDFETYKMILEETLMEQEPMVSMT